MRISDFLSGSGIAKQKFALKFFMASLPLVLLALAGSITSIVLGIRCSAAACIVAGIIITLAVAVYTFLLLRVFNRLVTPLHLANKALSEYVANGALPDLPTNYEDEVGTLLGSLQSTIRRLNNLVTEKSDMIDLLSHDLRSPVSRILSLASLIKEDDETEKDIYADYIGNECRSLLSMLENLLLTLKEDSQEFRMERVGLKKLMTDTLSFYHFAVSEKALQVAMTIDDDIAVHVQRQLFTQAVRNLLGNAIKFSPDGKVIAIEAKKGADHVSLSIRDEGMGFESGDMQKIFERFTSAGKRGTRGEASTGLGLYLSKKIIEKHGGKLIAESEGINRGASFTIILYSLITRKPQERLMKRAQEKKVIAVSRR